jgi:hypothetical protein
MRETILARDLISSYKIIESLAMQDDAGDRHFCAMNTTATELSGRAQQHELEHTSSPNLYRPKLSGSNPLFQESTLQDYIDRLQQHLEEKDNSTR